LKIGSVSSGIGGVELGFHRRGFSTAWFVEKELFCQKLLKQNFQNVPVYGDVKNFNAMLSKVGNEQKAAARA